MIEVKGYIFAGYCYPGPNKRTKRVFSMIFVFENGYQSKWIGLPFKRINKRINFRKIFTNYVSYIVFNENAWSEFEDRILLRKGSFRIGYDEFSKLNILK